MVTPGRPAADRTAGRKRRWEHARRRAADTTRREAEVSLPTAALILSEVGRFDDGDVSANRLKLGHELWPADDVDGLQAAHSRERDHPPPDCRTPPIPVTTHSPGFRLTYVVRPGASGPGMSTYLSASAGLP